MTPYQQFIHKSRYARWLDEEGRRETWPETVDRYIGFVSSQVDLCDDERSLLFDAIHDLKVMPSMRALMTAGPALERCNVAGYNCAYLPIDSLRSFDEAMYILLCGTGVGFSVESQYVDQLPRIAEYFDDSDTTIRVADSKEGWAKALRELISLLVAGQMPKWDVSGVRPKGSRLVTFGGRASGPEPLVDLFEFTRNLFRDAAGRRLTSLECHDLMCKIGDVVVVGGVRRSAMISLFDCTDDRMLKSKHGAWWEADGHRRLANNSAVYSRRKPDMSFFMEKWNDLHDGRSGEPGIFSRFACQQIAGRDGRRDPTIDYGTNPCSEIILRPFQFCNLTEVVVRQGDTLANLKQKCRLATILGTIQASLTDFKYLRKRWRDNCEEERLLGVSLTGICDNPEIIAKGDKWLPALREVCRETNHEWADRLNIARSAAITCVKPSGTVSQLVDSGSGLHARHSPFYLRTVRQDNKDPITYFLADQGVYHEPDAADPDHTTVFYFPVESPKGAMSRNDMSAIGQLTLWKMLQDNWCEHKPSCTVNVREEEWMKVGAWVYENFDSLSGVAFLPHDGGTYRQAPYQELSEDAFNAWVSENWIGEVDWDRLEDYETSDMTTGSQEFACTGNACEVP